MSSSVRFPPKVTSAASDSSAFDSAAVVSADVVSAAVVAAVVCVDAELPHPVDITTAAAAAKNKTLHCFFIIKFLLVNKKIYLFIV